MNELEPQYCVELLNNLNGKIFQKRTIKVFALVNETPSKSNNHGSVNNDTPNEVMPDHGQLSNIVSNLAKKPPLPLTPMSSGSNVVSDNSKEFTPNNVKNKLWRNQVNNDSDSDSNSSNEDSIFKEFSRLHKKLKRKAVESPESSTLAAFEKVLTKKQRKKLRKSLEIQK